MTTIAYNHKNKEIAVDSRFTRGTNISTDKGNKTKMINGVLWIFCGKCCDYDLLAELGHNEKSETPLGCSAMFIKDGKAYYSSITEEGYCEIEELKENLGLGSGSLFAEAAMDFGCSAKDAVKYAIKKDSCSGGAVRVFKLNNKKPL